jgi:hypothetical protein
VDASDPFDDGFHLRWTAADALRKVMDPECWEDVAAAADRPDGRPGPGAALPRACDDARPAVSRRAR